MTGRVETIVPKPLSSKAVFLILLKCYVAIAVLGFSKVLPAESKAEQQLWDEYHRILERTNDSMNEKAMDLAQLYIDAATEQYVNVAGMAIYQSGKYFLYATDFEQYQRWSKVHKDFYQTHKKSVTRFYIESLELLRLFSQMKTLELRQGAKELLASIDEESIIQNYSSDTLEYAITPYGIAEIFNYLGLAEHDLGLYDDAMVSFGRALEIYESLNATENIATVYGNIALIYAALGDLNEAITYNQKAIALTENVENSYAYYKAIVNNASYNISRYRTLKYKKELQAANELKQKVEGQLFELLNTPVIERLSDIKSDALYWLAYLYLEAGDINESEEYLRLVYQSIEGRGEESYYMQVKELEAYIEYAKENIERGIELTEEALTFYLKERKQDKALYALIDLSWAFEQIKDYESSLKYQKQYAKLQESMFYEQKTRFLAIEQEKNNAKMREKEIEILQQKNLASKLELEYKNQMIALSVGIALLIISIIYLRLKHKHKLAKQYQYLCHFDSLTHVCNRRFFQENIDRELAKIYREREKSPEVKLAIFILDIDHFKKLNDTYGHPSGDKVLVDFAERLKQFTRETDLLVRWGGEEFVLLGRVNHEREIEDYASRVLEHIRTASFTVEGQEIKVTCSLGGTVYPFIGEQDNEPHWSKLLGLADQALYHAKDNGRDKCVVYLNRMIKDSDEFDSLLEGGLDKALVKYQVTQVNA